MSDQIIIQAPKLLISTFLAKFILLLLLGSVIGLFTAQYQSEKYQKWKSMTPAEKKGFLEEQNRDYEKSMKEEPFSVWLTWGICVAVLWTVFTLYEILGKGMGLVIGKFIPLRESEL